MAHIEKNNRKIREEYTKKNLCKYHNKVFYSAVNNGEWRRKDSEHHYNFAQVRKQWEQAGYNLEQLLVIGVVKAVNILNERNK